MHLLSFDMMRTFDIPGARYLKPEHWLREPGLIQTADWVMFPEYWQVNALVYGLHKRIFPSLNSYHLGHDKIEMTRAFQAVCPKHTPLTLIRGSTPHAIEEILDTLPFPFVAKEVRSSMGRGVSLIEDRAAFRQYAHNNPVLYVQEYLPIRRDLRVVYIGDGVLTAYWREAAEGRFHNNVAQGATVNFERIPAAAIELVSDTAGRLGINHAGFDVAEVDGHYFFLEFNVRFGTDALNSRGLRVGPAIVNYLQQQMERPPHQPSGAWRKAG